MVERVKEFLEGHFQGMRADLETLPSGRVSGSLIWGEFVQDADQVARQRRVRAALEQHFGAETQQISVLLTYTPTEIAEMVEA